MKHRSWRKTGFQPTSLIAAVLLLLVVFVCVAYFFFLSTPHLSAELNASLVELQVRRDEWLEKRPPAYRYVVQRECDCPLDYIEPFTVFEYLDEPDRESWIDESFEALETAMQSGNDVSVRYDPRYSYPNDYSIDDEQTFVRDFDVLRYDDEL
ncbi:MAG: DUF6174 domain-containing protein [Woeseiaceae bacterium]